MSIGGQQEALRLELVKSRDDYKKLGVKHANVLKERDELVTIREDMLSRARKAEKQAEDRLALIAKHRDQRGDDRCWLDDQDMYTGAGLAPANTALPSAEVFAANCKRFHESRQRPGDKYITVAEMLAEERAKVLEAVFAALKGVGGRFEFDGHAETAEETIKAAFQEKPTT